MIIDKKYSKTPKISKNNCQYFGQNLLVQPKYLKCEKGNIRMYTFLEEQPLKNIV